MVAMNIPKHTGKELHKKASFALSYNHGNVLEALNWLGKVCENLQAEKDELRERINALEKENKELRERLKSSLGLRKTIYPSQNSYATYKLVKRLGKNSV